MEYTSDDNSSINATFVGVPSNPYGQLRWILSEVVLLIIAFHAIFMLYRLWKYSYPFFLVDMSGINGKIFYGFCISGFILLILVLVVSLVTGFISWRSNEICNVLSKINATFSVLCLQTVHNSHWLQQHYMTSHPAVGTKQENCYVEDARRIVLILLILFFPSYTIIFLIGDYHVCGITASTDGCLIHVTDATLPVIFWIYHFVLMLGIVLLFIPTCNTLKQKVAEDNGAHIAYAYEARTFFIDRASLTRQSEIRKRELLLKRIRRVSKLSAVSLILDLIFSMIYYHVKIHTHTLMTLMSILLLMDLHTVVLCLDNWKKVYFGKERRVEARPSTNFDVASSGDSEDILPGLPLSPANRTNHFHPFKFTGSIITVGNNDMISGINDTRRCSTFQPLPDNETIFSTRVFDSPE